MTQFTVTRSRPLLVLLFCAVVAAASVRTPPAITTPKQALGFNIGDDYHVANYSQLTAYWKQLASESNRMKLVDIGPTAEGRRQYMALISAPENLKRLDHFREISAQLAHADQLSDEQARSLARDGKAVIWIDGGLHATETVGSQQLMEHVYQMVSRSDPETLRFLRDDIQMCVLANPDGQELVANWYMRELDEKKRKLDFLPRLYQKYIGHDNNRDFYISNQPETTNMNRQMFIEWFPQIVYNHHQTGPAGAVIFMPPFRDPFNYNFDPLIPLGVEAVGTAMHERLVAEGKGGSAQRTGANYSTWWNGGLRTITYFHNMIGLLTEIIGNPTPAEIPLVPDKQLPTGDWPLPIAPQLWHYRQSIDYDVTNNRAILDYASRNRETLLYNIYLMGRNSIQNGGHDHWTITPDRIDALRAAASAAPAAVTEATNRRASQSGATVTPDAQLPAGLTIGGMGTRTVPADLYERILHDPAHRDARGYIIPADQADFLTATKFVNALLKVGVTVLRAGATFQVNSKTYPAGSYVVQCAQAFRPHVLDMFEPQHHPNDFLYPGGPPVPPYDSAGWTLAIQMGIAFDRILNGFDGPFSPVTGLVKPPPGEISGPAEAAGYLISHRTNDAFTVVNRLLKANADVYWLAKPDLLLGHDLGTGAIWVKASSPVLPILQMAARDLGVDSFALARTPNSPAWKLKPIRIALYDQYGGLSPSGWDRWLFEQYEFPYEVVYPQQIDAGHLKEKFDALVLPDEAFYLSGAGRFREFGDRQPKPADIPEQYRTWLGVITAEKTVPQIKRFLDEGGSVVAVGSSTGMAGLLGAPIENYLREMGSDGKPRSLPREKFYVPGSLLKVDIDNLNPLAYGMPATADVFFDNSPVFKLNPDAQIKHTSAVAWFSGSHPLESGWAWGQQYLDGGTAVAEAAIGPGKLVLLGPEVTFRAQPHGTFKLLFNGVFYGSAQPVMLQ